MPLAAKPPRLDIAGRREEGRQKGTTGAVRAASRMFEFFHIIFACHVGGEELRTSGMQAYSDSSLQGLLLRILGEVPVTLAGLRALILCFRELAKTHKTSAFCSISNCTTCNDKEFVIYFSESLYISVIVFSKLQKALAVGILG